MNLVPAIDVYRLTSRRIAMGYRRLSDGTIVGPPQSGPTHLTSTVVPLHEVKQESDDEIDQRIKERFEVLEMLALAAIKGTARALIITGPPGLGKSYTVEKMFQEYDPEGVNHTIVKGNIRATGLYKLLYQHRELGQVIIFDDADGVFYDEISLGLLKAVCDTSDRRNVSWRTQYDFTDDESGEKVPKNFDFEGTIIFISNIDMDNKIEKGDKMSPHLAALISRAHFIDVGMRSRRDYLIRIRHVLSTGLLSNKGFDPQAEDEVMAFILENTTKLRELSLRTALKIADLRKAGGDWKRVARVTCCKN